MQVHIKELAEGPLTKLAMWTQDYVSSQFRALLKKLGLNRKGATFYALRHTFRTVADETLDFPAVRLVMGHSDNNVMDETYRHNIGDERLKAVAEHVHSWLFNSREASR